MDKTPRELWVEGLRSGRFTQTQGILAKRLEGEENFRHCCLGVACEVAEENDVKIPNSFINDEFTAGASIKVWGGHDATLPPVVAEWLQVDGNPTTKPDKDGLFRTLSELNDNGATFESIADLIENDRIESATPKL